MGNPQSKPPQNYNSNEVHEGEYLQTYRPGGTNEKINMGTGQPPISIGAKVIKSTTALKDRHGNMMPAGEYYVETKEGSRVFLSSGGQWLDTAEKLIKNAKGYGEGPSLLLSGTPERPQYTMFASTSTSPGSDYTGVTVNNLGDLLRLDLEGVLPSALLETSLEPKTVQEEGRATRHLEIQPILKIR